MVDESAPITRPDDFVEALRSRSHGSRVQDVAGMRFGKTYNANAYTSGLQ